MKHPLLIVPYQLKTFISRVDFKPDNLNLPNKRHFMSLLFLIFAIKFSDMKKQMIKDNTFELKKEIKKTFDSMLQDVIKGKVSVQDFTQKVNQNYMMKKMELSGSLF